MSLERQDLAKLEQVMTIISIAGCSISFICFVGIAFTINIKASATIMLGCASIPVVFMIFVGIGRCLALCMKRVDKVSLFCVNCQKYRTGKPTHENNYYFNCRKCGELLTGNVARSK